MLDVQKVINRRRTYFKENDHIYPQWKKYFRYWRRIYLNLMKSDGFKESVQSYYDDLLDRRRKQSDTIRLNKRIKKHEAELLGLDSPHRATIVVNETTQIVTFANRERCSVEALRSQPELMDKIQLYCTIQLTR